MDSYFFLSTNVTNFVFYSLTTKDGAEMAGVCILFGLLTFILEGLIIWREYIAHAIVYYTAAAKIRQLQENRFLVNECIQNDSSADNQSGPPSRDFSASEDLKNVPAGIGQLKLFQWQKSFLASIGQMLYIFVSYLIMLAVMSYNAYLIISVVIASGLSYFLCRVWYIEFEKESIVFKTASTNTVNTTNVDV